MAKPKVNIPDVVDIRWNGKITVKYVDFPDDEDGTKLAYKIHPLQNQTAFFLIELDRQTFHHADQKVAMAVADLFSKIEVHKQEAKKVLDDFMKRKGKYKKIADRENRDIVKNALPKIKDVHLEVLAMVIQELLNDPEGDFSEVLHKAVINRI